MVNMDAGINTGLLQNNIRAQNQQLCPECGGKMTESERVCENGAIFVWFKCSDKNCSGQWLQKMPLQQPGYPGFSVNPAYAH
jgi:hypothetical protein